MIIHEGIKVKSNLHFCKEIFIEEHIQSGRYGDVFKVRNIHSGEYYALKHLRIRDKNVEKIIDSAIRISKEVIIDINSPYIVKAYGSFRIDHYEYCILFEYLDGNGLDDWLKKNQSTSWDIKQTLFIKILKAVKALHDQKIIHHDLKPQNIIITNESNLKIIDLGLSKIINKDITLSCNPIGTPSYIAPENYIGIDSTFQFDIFSLGCILYELRRGKNYFEICGFNNIPPFEKIIINNKLAKGNILDFDCEFPRKNETDKFIASIIKRATSFNTNLRIKNIDDFIFSFSNNNKESVQKIYNSSLHQKSPTDSAIQELKNAPMVFDKLNNKLKKSEEDFEHQLLMNKAKTSKIIVLFILVIILLFTTIILVGLSDEYKTDSHKYNLLFLEEEKENEDVKNKYDSTKIKLEKLEINYNYVKDKINDISFRIGKDIHDPDGYGYNQNHKLYFNTTVPILLNTVDVYAERKGSIVVTLFDNSENRQNSVKTEFKLLKSGLTRLFINYIFEKGNGHFLTYYSEETNLIRCSKNVNYPYEIKNAINILGESSNQDYYYYFYNWDFSIYLK